LETDFNPVNESRLVLLNARPLAIGDSLGAVVPLSQIAA
jgi:hypothetical protein